MNQAETVIEGTIQADGTLVLDQKPNLPAGRVTVRLQPALVAPQGDPFWQRMRAMWAIPSTNGPADGGASTQEEVRQLREEWQEVQTGRERLQEECRTVTPSSEETKP